MVKKIWFAILLCSTIVGFGFGTTAEAKTTVNTPTLFIHGLMGSHKSTDGLITAAETKANGKKVMTITVQNDGTVNVEGSLPSKTKRPLIQINFANNEASTTTQSQWLTKVLQLLQTKYHVTKYNVVAHSAGNVAFFQTVTQKSIKLPKLKKYVILAGPFNGVVGMNDVANQIKLLAHDQPQTYYPANDYYPGYQQLLDTSKQFPKNVKILNIYGDLNDGTNSDGLVTIQSELSINYLLYKQHESIKNVKMTGISHSGLHNSKQVNQKWIKFMW